MPANLETIVQRMIDAGEDEANIASVIQHYRDQERRTPGLVGVVNPATVSAANAGRAAAVRVGEELATSPAVSRVLSAASKPAAQMTARAVGVTGGLPGYIASEALTSPAASNAIDALLRRSGATLAKIAGSPLARGLTGLPGALATLPLESGDRPAGETPQRTYSRQAEFATKFKDQVNREAGREVITGNDAASILASIAAYRGRK